ncbi:PKD domain-containing protein [bacterium]|nr:PKD domain-containing protein [bacterium]MCI0606759.1 PKD domain-containing protein [bacterium]
MKIFRFWFLPFVLAGTLVVCKQVDLTAPTGAEIHLTAQPLSINFGATSNLTVTGTREGGAPLPDGTVIRFTVSDNLGAITPNPVETTNGIATATFIAGQRSGTAIITAFSGEIISDPTADIVIGEARVERLILTANPSSLPPEGGKVQLNAFVRDDQGNPVSGVQVFFSTDAGTLASQGDPVRTNAQGVAKDRLTTDEDATVTAIAGDQEEQVTISLGTQTGPECGSFVAPTTAAIGQEISFVDDSTEGDSTLRTSTWDFGDGASANGFVVTHSYDEAGTFVVVHTITDSRGLSDTCTPIEITVQEGEPPVCGFDVAPTDPDVGEQVSFADTSTDPDGTIQQSDWDFGDSNTATGFSTTHTYTSAGSFIVRHTVTDDQGLSSSCTATVNVSFVGTEPFCAFERTNSGSLTATFDASASEDTDENGESIVTFQWDFGDGETDTGQIVNHVYDVADTYTVILTITDDEGDTAVCSDDFVIP